jgi:hypothetical protein
MTTATQPWIMSDDELRGILASRRIAIGPRSPLAALAANADSYPAAGSAPTDQTLARAIETIARPSAIMGLLLSPPHGQGALWVYRGANELFAYAEDPIGTIVIAETTPAWLAARARECLQLQTPVESLPFKRTMSRAAYQALAGTIDCARQFVIESLIEREPHIGEDLSVDAVAEAVYAGWRTHDHRWFGGAVWSLTPFDFDFRFVTFKQGLEELTKAGWLTESDDAFHLTPAGEMLCASLGAPVAYLALNARRWDGRDWSRHHVAAFRGLGALWLLEFDERGGEPRVTLRSVNAPELDLLLTTHLEKWSAPGALPPAVTPSPPTSAPRPPETSPPTPAARFCVNCGKPFEPSDKFCRTCGTRR